MKVMTHLTVSRFQHAALALVIGFLSLLSFAVPATADTAVSELPAVSTDVTNQTPVPISDVSDSVKPTTDIAALPLLDSKGVPYYETAQTAPYISSQLAAQMATAGDIKSVYIDDARDLLVLTTASGIVMSSSYDKDPELLQSLFDAGVVPTFVTFDTAPVSETERIDAAKDNFNWSFALKLLPFLVLIAGCCIIYDLRQRKLAKLKKEPQEGETAYQTREGPAGMIPTVTFDDVAGCEEAMEDLSEIVDFLKNPERFERLGAKIPRGALLVGPPGTGKTLLARAVAGEAKVAFFAMSGSDFVEMYVGVGPARVRELFAKARAAEGGKAIVFIDEIDAVARSRAMSTKQNANDERENTLNALLHELDGFARSNVILLAATNRVDILDPAIIRPGRLDRKIQVPNPDRRGREKILAVHVNGKPLAKDVDLAAIARRTPGMSGADLAQIANEAAIEAARRSLKTINAACFSAAVALVAMGRARRSALVTDRDRLITAYHEAGHTVCALASPDAANPAGVSITPRGHAGGITWMNGTDDQYLARPQASAQLVVALGGRAGEEILLDGEFTQGPSSDLERATQLATVMVTKYGMTRRGLSVRSGEPDVASHEIIEEMLGSALDDARALLREHSALFLAIVNQLLEHDTLESSDIEEIIAALTPDQHPGFAEHTVRVLHQAGNLAQDAVEAVGSVARRATKVRRVGSKRPSSSELTVKDGVPPDQNSGSGKTNSQEVKPLTRKPPKPPTATASTAGRKRTVSVRRKQQPGPELA
jgi:cell division protease FtsH